MLPRHCSVEEFVAGLGNQSRDALRCVTETFVHREFNRHMSDAANRPAHIGSDSARHPGQMSADGGQEGRGKRGTGLEDHSFRFGVTPFYFIRHGETRESVNGVLQGQKDTRMLDRGRQSARKAAAALDGIVLRSIHASPLQRTWETASIVSLLTGVPVFSVWLMERNWGPYEGFPKDMRPSEPNAKSVESVDAFSSRIVAAMNSISGPAPVLIVSHSGVFRSLCHYTGLSEDPSVSLSSGMVLKFLPPGEKSPRWHIEAVC